ncbi:hypothetical protein VSR01_01630 [Actinacidiphila sp. DG2A-62]|nr:hypothetical protein [Actinacidiphila sp. DG2A-62]MEC3992312.1 hypothetical protein [Actinacidiphila sp. DG2A-62]
MPARPEEPYQAYQFATSASICAVHAATLVRPSRVVRPVVPK